MTNKDISLSAFRVVAIDGGAASGKSSTSGKLADRLNFMHVDTGSHYRAVTYVCLHRGMPPQDSPELHEFLKRLVLATVVIDHCACLSIDSRPPLTDRELRSPEVNSMVSPFSAIPSVRQAVKAYQKAQVDVARHSGFAGIVMDGRDIGTVILPDADLKIFLKADPDTRQRRRQLEGTHDTIGDRDKRDASRATAPMKVAHDAVVIDNSAIPLEEVVERIVSLVLAL